MVGLALFYGDAIITPAISVMSAVEGLSAVAPAFTPFVVPLALVILVALFMLQSRGTADVGRLFGPVMLLWFVVLGVLGACADRQASRRCSTPSTRSTPIA